MAYSYNWLKTYFDKEIPSPEDVGKGIIFHSFEVEGMETKAGDTILDIKILPDRAHDCLCHTGIAGEICAIFDLPKRTIPSDYGDLKKEFTGEEPSRNLEVKIDCPDLCRRYIGRMVENVTVGSSPAWLKERLESIGQRSISNIVDATNFVLFDLGQPMHAFDADKVKGSITVRRATDGEKMTTLDGKELCLTADNMVIADDQGPLALAGIKGGNRAEVDVNTKNIILESANFDPVNIRRTSAFVGIRTDASKRYENDFSPEVADEAMDRLSSLLYEISGREALKMGEKIDVYPKRVEQRLIEIKSAEVSLMLGIDVPEEEIVTVLKNLDLVVEKIGETLKLTIPFRRVDLEAKENIVEEIGRIYGYDKIPPKLLDSKIIQGEEREANKRFRVANKVRETLIRQGFSEVYGYAFTPKGEVEIANPLALDRPYLRTNLSDWIKEKLQSNLLNVLFDAEAVKIFELGRVFNKIGNGAKESTLLCLGIARRGVKQKIQESLRGEMVEAKNSLKSELFAPDLPVGEEMSETDNVNNLSFTVWEGSFDELAKNTGVFVDADLTPFISLAHEYKKVSAYPRIIRDIALFVPEEVNEEEVAGTIEETAGLLLAQEPALFDVFVKGGKKSLAFRLVFQSYEKTLSDEEVNGIMNQVVAVVSELGWVVR